MAIPEFEFKVDGPPIPRQLQFYLGEIARYVVDNPEFGTRGEDHLKIALSFSCKDATTDPVVTGIMVHDIGCDHKWDGPEGFGMGGPTIGCSRCGTRRAD